MTTFEKQLLLRTTIAIVVIIALAALIDLWTRSKAVVPVLYEAGWKV